MVCKSYPEEKYIKGGSQRLFIYMYSIIDLAIGNMPKQNCNDAKAFFFFFHIAIKEKNEGGFLKLWNTK